MSAMCLMLASDTFVLSVRICLQYDKWIIPPLNTYMLKVQSSIKTEWHASIAVLRSVW